MAADDGRVDRFSDGLRIGSNGGTKINLLAAGQITVTAGQTTGAATVTGVDTGSICVVTSAENAVTANYFVTPTANTLTITVSATAGEDDVFNYLVVDN